jgi:hypothetical protein
MTRFRPFIWTHGRPVSTEMRRQAAARRRAIETLRDARAYLIETGVTTADEWTDGSTFEAIRILEGAEGRI